MHRIPALLFLAVACLRPLPAEKDPCVEHLKAIGVAAFKYPERGDRMPVCQPGFFEAPEIAPSMLRCPATPKEDGESLPTDYESWSAHRISPAMIAKFGEILPPAWDAAPRREGSRNVVFGDGRVETLAEADFQERMKYFQDQEEFDWSGKVRLDPATRDWIEDVTSGFFRYNMLQQDGYWRALHPAQGSTPPPRPAWSAILRDSSSSRRT